mmetsp:Transcript_11012/g.36465  ORF Transcript_11012/g.36465 Transcript_11012/m.36465 type:complete len:233 (+) Transcript_11012:812-1510(+)
MKQGDSVHVCSRQTRGDNLAALRLARNNKHQGRAFGRRRGEHAIGAAAEAVRPVGAAAGCCRCSNPASCSSCCVRDGHERMSAELMHRHPSHAFAGAQAVSDPSPSSRRSNCSSTKSLTNFSSFDPMASTTVSKLHFRQSNISRSHLLPLKRIAVTPTSLSPTITFPGTAVFSPSTQRSTDVPLAAWLSSTTWLTDTPDMPIIGPSSSKPIPSGRCTSTSKTFSGSGSIAPS